MKVRDRLSGQSQDAPGPAPAHLGRWSLDPGVEDAYLNGAAVAPGDLLVPGASGEWRLIAGQTDTRGRFLGDCLPDPQDIDAFLGFGDLLAGPWLEWCDRSPLAPGLGEVIKPHPLESAIERELGHLAVVCLRPQTHIRLEPERLAVSRARRFDRKVYAHLAAHTEDWAQRKLTGVQPSHVLAQVREEQWDLYENRVAVRLVDELAAWLSRRLSEVRRILDGVFARLEEQGAVSGVNWRRRERLYRVWGEATEATAARTLAERTCKRLEVLLYRVLGLMDSPLYRAIPNRAQVPRGLRMTNLFANHDQYRGVARLWDQWSRQAASGSLSPAQLYQRHQGLARGFDAWCLLLVVRGLQQLGYEPLDAALEQPLEPGCAIELERGYRLTWDWDGIRLWDGDSARIRLLPLAHALDRLKPPQLPELDDIAQAVAEQQGPWTVILHPAVPEPAGNGLAGVLDPPRPEVPGALDWLRVSPFALDSVERVSRLLRWALLAPRLLAYPPNPGTVPPEFIAGLSGRIGPPSGGSHALLVPMADHEVAKLGVNAAARTAEEERRRLTAARDDLDRRLRELRGDRRERVNLNLEKRNLLEPLRRAEANATTLQDFQASLRSAQDVLADLSICPVCGGQGRLMSRGGDCFDATCQDPSCAARWGLRLGESGERLPVLEIGWLQNHALPPSYKPTDVDDALGCDVLAVPAADMEGGVNWRTPRHQALEHQPRRG